MSRSRAVELDRQRLLGGEGDWSTAATGRRRTGLDQPRFGARRIHAVRLRLRLWHDSTRPGRSAVPADPDSSASLIRLTGQDAPEMMGERLTHRRLEVTRERVALDHIPAAGLRTIFADGDRCTASAVRSTSTPARSRRPSRCGSRRCLMAGSTRVRSSRRPEVADNRPRRASRPDSRSWVRCCSARNGLPTCPRSASRHTRTIGRRVGALPPARAQQRDERSVEWMQIRCVHAETVAHVPERERPRRGGDRSS